MDLPWKPRSLQEIGRQKEKGIADSIGARLHPNSGAGSIKQDMSDKETITEAKTAGKSFQMSDKYMNEIYKNAVRQGKNAQLIVQFPNCTVTCIITRTNIKDV